jgi:hypothetical protein
MSTTLQLRAAASLVLSLIVGVSACDDEPAPASAPTAEAGPKYEPKIDASLVAPAAKGLVLGVATEKDVVAAFGAGEVVKDKSLGGAAKVEYSDAPAIQIALPAKDAVVSGEAWLVPDKAGEPRLSRLSLTLTTTDTCKWIDANLGKHEAAKRRPGSNRVFGKNGEYTAGNSDGTIAVGVDCHTVTTDGTTRETLEYSLEASSGRSMLVNRDP